VSGSAWGVGLIAVAVLLPSLPTQSGPNFIETRLCASGRVLRIELPGQDDPGKQAPMPCHAVCGRGNDGAIKDPHKRPKL
jgi:hypothetical protein